MSNQVKTNSHDYIKLAPDPRLDSRQDSRPTPPSLAPAANSSAPQTPYDHYHYYPHMQVQQGAYFPMVRPGILPPGVQQIMQRPGQNMVHNMGQNMSLAAARDPHVQPLQSNQPRHPANSSTTSFDERYGYQSSKQVTHQPNLVSLSSTLYSNDLAAVQIPGLGSMRGQLKPNSVQAHDGSNGVSALPVALMAPSIVGSGSPSLAQTLHTNGPVGPLPTQPNKQDATLSSTLTTPTQSISKQAKSSAYPRKRSHTACDTCRQKKVKCDNVRPQCGSCKRNNSPNCRYITDEPSSDYSGYDPAHINILAKLDVIIRQTQGEDDSTTSPPKKRRRHEKRTQYFQRCLWDMSFPTVFRWGYLRKVLGSTPDEASVRTSRLIHECSDYTFPFSTSPRTRFEACDSLERLLNREFPTFMNSFLVNCHTKVPCLDIITLVESVEIYTLMKRADEKHTFISMLNEYNQIKPTERVPNTYKEALEKLNIEDSPIRQRLYRTCCESVPLLLVICAIGALATPIRLDNIGTYNLSLEEKNDIKIGCVDLSAAEPIIPRDRCQLSNMLVSYALIISVMFPNSLRPNSIVSVEYHILCSQYYQYIMDPLKAHREIMLASTEMMYFLQREALGGGNSSLPEYDLNGNRLVVNRLFWTCLKLESELRTELSPHVPLSEITQIVPPSSFMRIPDPLLEDEHLPECIRLASKYDDKNSWLYFLTEIAMRKVDNKLFDEMYSEESVKNLLWDQPKFAETTVWHLLIKYLNQYNGIISSLSPPIRKFVLLEVNVDQIYSIMKKRADKKRKMEDSQDDIFENLDEFLIDDDLLLRALSESVMLIKTRIVASVIALFRPLVYLFLEDKILFLEIAEAAASVLPQIQMSQADQVVLQELAESPMTGSSSTNNDTHDGGPTYKANFANFLGEDASHFDISNASHVYLKRFPEDDFSDLIDYADGLDEFDENFIRINDMVAARKRILRVLIRKVITLPKLNVPKIGLHRHAGSWFYIRNLCLGVVIKFLLYKKVQESVIKLIASTDEEQKQNVDLEALNVVFNRETLKAALEHSLLIVNYWKDERKDCHIYGEYIRRCLDNI